MPVCVTCAYPALNIYTVYKTRSNIRLAACSKCHSFVDPLIEHPPILHVLDLVLLKPRVFLHLLYNRGTLPLVAPGGIPDPTVDAISESVNPTPLSASSDKHDSRYLQLRSDFIRLACLAVVAETAIRALRLGAGGEGADGSKWMITSDPTGPFLPPWELVILLLRTSVELAAQLCASTILAVVALSIRGLRRDENSGSASGSKSDGRMYNFHNIIIPLTLLYTSILPLLLHLILGIWYTPPSSARTPNIIDLTTNNLIPSILLNNVDLPPKLLDAISTLIQTWYASDLIWTGTRLLGGMSAGFGLRVVLPLRPVEVTGIVLLGWGAAATAGLGVEWAIK